MSPATLEPGWYLWRPDLGRYGTVANVQPMTGGVYVITFTDGKRHYTSEVTW
jgi:hypothetical protein